jgi:S1-C subfamily serine protease
MKWVLSLVLVSLASTAFAEDVGPYLQSISVNIQAGSSQGSGTIVLVPREGKDQTAFVITAQHVVDGLRQVKTVIKDGKERKVVRYNDASVVQEVPNPDASRIVGDTSLDAKVICVDEARDIAILQIRAKGKFTKSAKFCTKKVLPVATEILHCGAPGGKDTGGSASVTSGIISRTGVRIQEFGGSENGIFDQVDCPGMPGSSGGMVCKRDTGEWSGMITLGLRSGDNFHWMVPIRSVRDFADEAGLEWLFKPDGKVPDNLDEIPLEVTAGVSSFSAVADSESQYQRQVKISEDIGEVKQFAP